MCILYFVVGKIMVTVFFTKQLNSLYVRKETHVGCQPPTHKIKQLEKPRKDAIPYISQKQCLVR